MEKRKVTLCCENCLRMNYVTNKSRGNEQRLVMNKFCSHCRAKTLHKEEK